MADPAALSIAFIEKHSAAAARALVGMDHQDAAALLEAIPSRIAEHAFAAMPAWSAAVIMSGMSTPAAAAVLQRVDYPQATAILRLMDPPRRPAILDSVPGRLKRDFLTSLSYPDDTVGAHMTTAVLALGRRHTVDDALAQLRQVTHGDVEVLFVVDDGKRLAGTVKTAGLLRYPGDTALEAVMDDTTRAIAARALLATVRGLEAWDELAELPVKSRQGHLIGALARRTLRHVGQSTPSGSVSLAGAFGEALSVTAGGLLRLLTGATAPVPPEEQP